MNLNEIAAKLRALADDMAQLDTPHGDLGGIDTALREIADALGTKMVAEGYLYDLTHEKGHLVWARFSTAKPTREALITGKVLAIIIEEQP